jgi:hypothetical protein
MVDIVILKYIKWKLLQWWLRRLFETAVISKVEMSGCTGVRVVADGYIKHSREAKAVGQTEPSKLRTNPVRVLVQVLGKKAEYTPYTDPVKFKQGE